MITTTATLDLAGYCTGHGGVCEDCFAGYCDGADHGIVSYCDGTCASATIQFENYLATIPRDSAERPADTTDAITVEVSADGGWRTYLATFEGPDADTRAAAYITARSHSHSFAEMPTRPFSANAFPKVTALLYPTCDHGMSADNCHGFDHFMSRDQEIALGF